MFLPFAQVMPPAAGLPGSPGGASGEGLVDPGLVVYRDVESIIGRVINVALGFSGVLAIIMIIIGGFLYLTSAGDEERSKKGRKFLIYSLLGLVIISLSYSIAFTLLSAPTAEWDRSNIDYNYTNKTGQGLKWLGSDMPDLSWGNFF